MEAPYPTEVNDPGGVISGWKQRPRLHVQRGDRMWFDIVRDGLRQVYLLKNEYGEGTGQALSYAVTLRPHLIMRRLLMTMKLLTKAFYYGTRSVDRTHYMIVMINQTRFSV